MKSMLPLLLITLLPLSGCSETTSALVGGGTSVNKPLEIAPSLYKVTCQRGNLTQCMIAAKAACDGDFKVIEQFSHTGFVNGDPAHLVDATLQCAP
jgi:hypothetical protein